MHVVRSLCLSLSACLIASGTLAADLIWIEAEPAVASTGETVRLRLFDGEPRAGSPGELGTAQVHSYQRVWNSGRDNLMRDAVGAEGARFRSAEAGLQLVTLETVPSRPAKSDERATFFCKSFVVVGRPRAAGQLHFSEVGHRLEIVPQTDPVELARGGGTLELQVLFEREPLAGARVFAIGRGSKAGAVAEARTDEIGLARIRLDGPGTWLVFVEHRVRCADCKKAVHERLASSLVLYNGGS